MTAPTPTPTPTLTFAELLLRRRHDEHPGLVFEDQSYSWSQIVRASAARAAHLRRGSHIGVLLDNVPDYVFWIGAAALAGATVVGINPTRRGEQLAGDIRHTDVDLIVTEEAHLSALDGLDTQVPADCVVLIEHGAFDEVAVPTTVPADHVLLLLFTSGSTGAPKAVVCTSSRMGRLAEGAATKYGIERSDVLYQSMPMFHGNALMSNVSPALAVGATVVLRRKFSASGFLPDVRRHGVTYFNYVGRALSYILAIPEGPHDRDNVLRLGFGTEASVRDIDTFTARFGCQIIENYGSSEGVISISRVPGTPRGALGLPAPDADVVVVDAERRECPPATFGAGGALTNPELAIGEIVRRGGAAAFEGYYRNEEATAARVQDGWYYSGDLAYRDADGWFWFAGRNADWLRVDSENFAAGPVEAILSRYPQTRLAAVYAVPDARTGDQVMAALEVSGAFDPEDFAEFLRAQPDLGTKWAPRYLRLIEAMPVTGTNKVDKKPLRRERWDARDVWSRPDRDLHYRPFTDADRGALEAMFAEHGRTAVFSTAGSS